MFKSYWIGAIAFGLVFGFGIFMSVVYFLNYQQRQAEDRKEATSDYVATSNERPEPCGSIMSEKSFFDWLACFGDSVTAPEGQKASAYDLKAQQDMAAWALGMLIISFWLTVITLIGVYYVWRTLSVTREIGRDQTRAYVEVEDVQFYWGNRQNSAPKFKIILTNHGTTPAKWFQLRQTFRIFEHSEENPIPDTFSELVLKEEFGEVWNGISPRNTSTQINGPEVKDDRLRHCLRPIEVTERNTHGIFVYGEVKYCTVFNEIFVSQYLFGIGTLEEYQAEGRVDAGDVTYRGQTRKRSTVFEAPQKLQRLSIALDLYKKAESQD